MTLVIGGAQRESVHSNASLCNDCDHTVFVSSMFTMSVTEVNSQQNVVSHYGQVYISQKVCVSGSRFIALFLVLVGTTTSQKFDTFNILYKEE